MEEKQHKIGAGKGISIPIKPRKTLTFRGFAVIISKLYAQGDLGERKAHLVTW